MVLPLAMLHFNYPCNYQVVSSKGEVRCVFTGHSKKLLRILPRNVVNRMETTLPSCYPFFFFIQKM